MSSERVWREAGVGTSSLAFRQPEDPVSAHRRERVSRSCDDHQTQNPKGAREGGRNLSGN